MPPLGKLQANPAAISIIKGMAKRKVRLISMAASRILDMFYNLDRQCKANILSLPSNVKNKMNAKLMPAV